MNTSNNCISFHWCGLYRTYVFRIGELTSLLMDSPYPRSNGERHYWLTRSSLSRAFWSPEVTPMDILIKTGHNPWSGMKPFNKKELEYAYYKARRQLQ